MIDFNILNRWRFTDEFIDEMIARLKEGRIHHQFIEEYDPKLKGDRLFVDGKPLIRESNRKAYVAHVLLNTAAPSGIESLHAHIGKHLAYGISRRDIKSVLQRDPKYRSMQRRGDRPTGRKYEKEGKTKFITSRHPHGLGMDLIELGRRLDRSYVGDARFLLVVVHKYTGYTWVEASPNKEASTILSRFKKIYPKALKLFGKPTYLERDDGGEFKGAAWDAYRKEKGMKDRQERKSSFVEARNSLLQRNLHLIVRQHTFEKALELAVAKVNNTPNRTLGGKTPLEMSKMSDITKIKKTYKKYKNKPNNKVRKFKQGDRVRYLMKKGQRETQGVGYKSFTPHWSRTIHVVEKEVRGGKYKISDISYTLFPDELQKVIAKPEPLTTTDKEEQAAEEPEGAVAKMIAQREADRQPSKPSPSKPSPSKPSPSKPSQSKPSPSKPSPRKPPAPSMPSMPLRPRRRILRERLPRLRRPAMSRRPTPTINKRPANTQQRQVNALQKRRDALERLRARQRSERAARALRRDALDALRNNRRI